MYYIFFQFTIIDDNDYADVTWSNKKSRYLYTYDLKSPDLFSTSDSESIYSDQSKETGNNHFKI